MFGQHWPGARITSDPINGVVWTATWCPICLGFYDLLEKYEH